MVGRPAHRAGDAVGEPCGQQPGLGVHKPGGGFGGGAGGPERPVPHGNIVLRGGLGFGDGPLVALPAPPGLPHPLQPLPGGLPAGLRPGQPGAGVRQGGQLGGELLPPGGEGLPGAVPLLPVPLFLRQPGPALGQGGGGLVQLAVPGQPLPVHRQPVGQGLPGRGSGLGGGAGGVGGGLFLPGLFQRHLCGHKLLPGGLPLLCRPIAALRLPQGGFGGGKGLLLPGKALPAGGQHPVVEGQHLGGGQLPGGGKGDLPGVKAPLRHRKARRRLADGGREGPALLLEGALLLGQPVLQPGEPLGVEQLAEDLLALVGGGQQHPEEVPLGDHRDLAELLPGEPQQLGDPGGDLGGPGEGALDPLAGEGGPGRLPGEASAPAGGPVVGGAPADGIAPPGAEELHLHKGRGLRGGVLAAEHRRLPADAAGLPVEGEGDGVKEGGLAGAGVPGDEVEPVLPELLHRQGHLPGVGAKGGEGQFQRAHCSSSSQISRISRRSSAVWSGVGGLPFCCS